ENQKVPLETETKDHGTALPWWFRALCFTYSAVGLNMVLRVQAMSCSCPQELPVARRGGPAAAPGRALLLARRVLRRELPSRKDRRQDDFGHVPHLLPAAQIHILPHGRGAARVALRLLVAGSALFSRRQDAERTPPGTRAATTCCTRCGTWRCRWEASSGSSTPAAHSRGTCGRMPRRGGPRTSLHWAAARPRPCRSIGPPPRAAAVGARALLRRASSVTRAARRLMGLLPGRVDLAFWQRAQKGPLQRSDLLLRGPPRAAHYGPPLPGAAPACRPGSLCVWSVEGRPGGGRALGRAVLWRGLRPSVLAPSRLHSPSLPPLPRTIQSGYPTPCRCVRSCRMRRTLAPLCQAVT
ncbi:unnamed protein product, partial [Prorocentrum cordatum]